LQSTIGKCSESQFIEASVLRQVDSHMNIMYSQLAGETTIMLTPTPQGGEYDE